jgi:hypothetical protein
MTNAPRLPACFQDAETRKLIDEICQTHRIDIKLLEEILLISLQYSGSGRARGVSADLAIPIETFITRSEAI